jgi:prefoldin alpha subunit
MEQQECFMRVQMLGQEAEKIEQQLQVIDQQITELSSIKDSLETLKKDNNKEILANLGKGIFVRADIKEKDLFVNIGGSIVVKKSMDETIEVITNQNERLLAGKEQLVEKIREIQENMQELMSGMNTSAEQECSGCSDESCKHDHAEEECDGNCDCEEPCEDCKHKK